MRTLHGTVVERDGQSLLIELETGLRVTTKKTGGLGMWDKCLVVYDFKRKEVIRIEGVNERFDADDDEPDPASDLPGEVGDIESTQLALQPIVDEEMLEALEEEKYHDLDDVLDVDGDGADILLPLGDAS